MYIPLISVSAAAALILIIILFLWCASFFSSFSELVIAPCGLLALFFAMSPLALSPLLSVVHLLPSVCIRTASVYLGVCSLYCVLSPVALLPVLPVVVGDLPPLVCRSPVAAFFLVFSLLHTYFLPILVPPCH
jgi:hypothetical protein